MEEDMKEFLGRIEWYFRQLFPLWYHTKYKENGKMYVTWWKMWWGHCYKQETFEVVDK